MYSNLRTVFKTALALVCLFNLRCSGNAFETFASQTTDEAYYYTAQAAINSGNFNTAVTACTNMSAAFLTVPANAMLCASAYAGRCGLNTFNFIANLTAATAPLNAYLLTVFLGNTTLAEMADCQSAETLVRSIGEATARTDDENFFMMLLSLFKISTYMNNLAASVNGNGTIDAGFDVCTTASVSDVQAGQIGSAFWELHYSLNQLVLNPAFSNTTFTTLNGAVADLCTALAGLTVPAAEDLCGAASPTVLNAAQLCGARSLMKEGFVFGIGQGGTGAGASIVTQNCPSNCP